MTAASAVPVEAIPLDFGDSNTQLSSRNDVNRDKTRYIACLGNHLESTDARQLTSIGAWAGGVWVGHNESEGAPTLRRTHHMVLRGLFCPLETVAISKKADHKETEAHRESYLEGPKVPPFTRGYTVYAGDDLAYLQSDRFRPLGIVEITPLYSVEWNTELRRSLQHFFFPEWQIWQRGEGEIPELLSDWEDLVKAAQVRAQYQSHDIIAEELLESARLFRTYATNQIEKNRQAIQSMRAADHGGQYVSWHNKCRVYAKQLGIVLEDENTLSPASSGNSDSIAIELRKDRELREKELEVQREQNRILIAKLLNEPIELSKVEEEPEPVKEIEPLIPSMADVSLGVSETAEEVEESQEPEVFNQLELGQIPEDKNLTYGCVDKNAKGEPCNAKLKPGEDRCTHHYKMFQLKDSE